MLVLSIGNWRGLSVLVRISIVSNDVRQAIVILVHILNAESEKKNNGMD